MTSRLNKPDTQADITLRECLDGVPPKSFVMIAGAGSGKTTSLVKALYHVLNTRRKDFRKFGQKVACITYTEIAAKEIWEDVGNDPQAEVCTIHSFLWTVIAPFKKDIKDWVLGRVDEKLAILQENANAFTNRTRETTKQKNAADQMKLIASKELISVVPFFNYGTGSDYVKGILGHDDILRIVPDLLPLRPLLKTIIAQKFPIIFVDESQDTSPIVVEFLKEISRSIPAFCVGFFGDPMQKIYVTGIGDITLEDRWVRITKPENFRCPIAVLNVINRIRAAGDGLHQTPGRSNTPQGIAKIFILPIGDDRAEKVDLVKKYLFKTSQDEKWLSDELKTLVIVHRMAAKRLGFPDLYSAMNDQAPSILKDSLQEGTSWPVKPFLSFILPIFEAIEKNDNFRIMGLLRENSPLLAADTIAKDEIVNILQTLLLDVVQLGEMLSNDLNTTTRQVLDFISAQKLIILDPRFEAHLNPHNINEEEIVPSPDEETNRRQLGASMVKLLAVPVKQFRGYRTYIQDESTFATQQGIKGAEYERVIAVLDDEEGTNNLFSYDKLFGIKELSETDQENIDDGKDYSVPRTRRLFYVSCSRATNSLAVIYFTSQEMETVAKIRESGIFDEADIHSLADIT